MLEFLRSIYFIPYEWTDVGPGLAVSWARHLGRDRVRWGRRLDRLPPPGCADAGVRRRGRARAPRRPGDRPVGQLVQPGAVRRAHHVAVGPADRRRAPSGRVRLRDDLPPDVPVRAAPVSY